MNSSTPLLITIVNCLAVKERREVDNGYDDNIKIKNTNLGGVETTGALLIINSWGKNWGDEGYGWLPYQYVLDGLAIDWWSLLKKEWIDTDQFK